MTAEAKKVAVQYGHIFRNNIHNTGDWCMYLKGGSSYFRVEGNELYNAGSGLMELLRSTFYYRPVGEDAYNLTLMRLIDEQFTKRPFYGVPRMTASLQALGYRTPHEVYFGTPKTLTPAR